MKRNNVEKVVS